ncbi:Re/Si-specific NAD(P)(+) transhydrogenase subunit alpha [Candidatus Sumerlaeota bacterium]|nr:Re/Si-specific NAD(P)(+) transhydrogenase subunit alpha [Candidatus Sumerlaeota bacterium]
MKIGVPKEIASDETRVALDPKTVGLLTKKNHEISIESGAGVGSSFSDDQYRKAGATIVPSAAPIYAQSDVILKVLAPSDSETEAIREGGTLISFMSPHKNPGTIAKLASRRVTVFAMEFVPRISRAQTMDALSSMATLGGYKAVLMAADRLPKIFPLMMTAAGSIPAATVLVLGVGVAGLQAIATAKRLGARVEAFDPRPAVKEQVQSVGATFVEIPVEEDVETAGGYAKEQSEAFLKKEQDVIAERLPKVDVVISTAQIFGKKAPILITLETLKRMRPGTVIVDLAAEQGGNCEATKPNETVVVDGVTILGPTNLPATLPNDASLMYSKNVMNLFNQIFGTENGQPDFEEEVTKGACIARGGAIVNDIVRGIVEG